MATVGSFESFKELMKGKNAGNLKKLYSRIETILLNQIYEHKDGKEYVGKIDVKHPDERVVSMMIRVGGILETKGLSVEPLDRHRGFVYDNLIDTNSLKTFLINFYNKLYDSQLSVSETSGGKKSKRRRSKKANKTKRNIRRCFF